MASKFRNAGQVCIASNRVLVQSGIHDAFVAKLKETMEKSMVLGDGMDQGVNQVLKITLSHYSGESSASVR